MSLRRHHQARWRRPVSVVVTPERILHLVGRIADLVLHGATRLVDLALAAQVVVVGEVAGSLLDAALRSVDVAVSHGGAPLDRVRSCAWVGSDGPRCVGARNAGSTRRMTRFGYTMMCEQSRPDQLVRDLQAAEQAGFDFSVISDHYAPWLDSQGHSGYAWSILGAAAQATEQIPLMTYVTCPILRYHPAVVAQKAATMQILSGGRFRLGLGAGENLNEHVVGEGWPAVGTRHSMLSEALDVINALFDAKDDAISWHGDFFDLETARLWDLPEQRVPIGVAVSGEASCTLA